MTNTSDPNATTTAAPPALPVMPERLNWLADLHGDDSLKWRYEDTPTHPLHHPFFQKLGDDLFAVATDGRLLIAVAVTPDEVGSQPIENLLDFHDKKNESAAERKKRATRTQNFLAWLTPDDSLAGLVIDANALAAWSIPTDSRGGACPYCKGDGHDPDLDAETAIARLGIEFDGDGFEFMRDPRKSRLGGVLIDRNFLGDLFERMTPTGEVKIVVPPTGEKVAPIPLRFFGNGWRALLMPQVDKEPSEYLDPAVNFPVAEYRIARSWSESGDALAVPDAERCAVLDLVPRAGGRFEGDAPPSVKLRTREVEHAFRLATECETVVLVRASKGWYVDGLYDAQLDLGESEVRS